MSNFLTWSMQDTIAALDSKIGKLNSTEKDSFATFWKALTRFLAYQRFELKELFSVVPPESGGTETTRWTLSQLLDHVDTINECMEVPVEVVIPDNASDEDRERLQAQAEESARSICLQPPVQAFLINVFDHCLPPELKTSEYREYKGLETPLLWWSRIMRRCSGK